MNHRVIWLYGYHSDLTKNLVASVACFAWLIRNCSRTRGIEWLRLKLIHACTEGIVLKLRIIEMIFPWFLCVWMNLVVHWGIFNSCHLPVATKNLTRANFCCVHRPALWYLCSGSCGNQQKRGPCGATLHRHICKDNLHEKGKLWLPCILCVLFVNSIGTGS